MKNSRLLLAAATLLAASAQAADFNWSTGTAGDASGAWSGSAFNGQVYDGTSNLTIDGTATKTITTSGSITTPASLTVSATGTSGNTITSGAGNAGAGAVTLTGTAIGGTLNKTGNADLVLATANTFGTVNLSSGKFFVNNEAGLGTTGTLNVNTGAAAGVVGSYTAASMANFFYDSTNLNANSTFSKNIAFGSVATNTTYAMAMRAGAAGTPLTTTLSGNITGAAGAGNPTLWLDVGASTSLSTWILSGDNSGFAGNIRLNRGNIQFNSAASMGTGTIFIQTNGTDGVANASNLTFGAGFTGTVTNAIILRGGSGTTTSLDTGANNITLSNTLTLSGDATAGNTHVFSKNGSGTLTLTGAVNTLEKLGGTATATNPLVEGALDVGNVNANIRAGAIDASGMTGSTLTFGSLTGAAGTSLVLGAKELAINGATSGTFAGVISGTGATVTKSGTGALTLSGANTYSGGTVISNGAVIANTSSALGTGAVTANFSYGTTYTSAGSAFLAAGVSGLTLANDISVSSTAGYYSVKQLAAAGGTLTLSGVISGGGSGVVLQLDTGNSGDSTSSVTLSGNNTFSGQIRLNRGTVTLTNANAAGTADIFLQSNGNASGNLVFSNSFTLANNVVFGTTGGNVIGTGANNVTLSGVISSGTSSWAKAGAGKLTLTGTNTFGGLLNVNAGTVATGNTAALGVASVSVASGATLQVGDATVNTVTLGSSATLAIANGATLKLGAINLASLDALIGTNGVITLAGGTSTYTFNSSGQLDLGGVLNNLTAGSHTYNLITGSGIAGTDVTLANITGFDSSVTLNSFTNGVLSFTAVPEPSTYGLIGSGVLAAVAFVRRRRSSLK